MWSATNVCLSPLTPQRGERINAAEWINRPMLLRLLVLLSFVTWRRAFAWRVEHGSRGGNKVLQERGWNFIATVVAAGLVCAPHTCHALDAGPVVFEQSSRWEESRLKRTQAIKEMAQKGVLKLDTDDSGNQFLSLPWIPNRKLPYKSLSLETRLINEVCAGAFGEISKDVLLHSVDTAKTRRQARLKKKEGDNDGEEEQTESGSPLAKLKDLYAGFPVVAASSIPQGGVFFLVKKSLIEVVNMVNPAWSVSLAGQALPIGVGVAAYWLFRTPAEVLKTQVQTRQLPSVSAAIDMAKVKNENGLRDLWKYYPVMLSLDIPFQVVNFILYGALSDAVVGAGVSSSIWTRLFCGTTCGMISAGLTCPIDVCKTRIISRDKAEQEEKYLARLALAQAQALALAQGQGQDQIETEGDVSAVTTIVANATTSTSTSVPSNSNVLVELSNIYRSEGVGALFLGIRQRLVYTGLANGIRLAAYGTSRMDLMMRSLDLE